jgi:predicted GIY-YIG superfamily endonuclease
MFSIFSLASPKGVAIQYYEDFMRQSAVYIMANFRNGTLYVGATSDLIRRTYAHKEGLVEGFTKKYGCKKLVYYEQHATMPLALEREQQIKSVKKEETRLNRRTKSQLE